MKRSMSIIFMMATILSVCVSPCVKVLNTEDTAVSAQVCDGTYYTEDEDSVTITLAGDTGEEAVIPESIAGKPVRCISDGAFSEYRGELRKVVLPSTVEVIGDNAFAGCSGLREIDLENVRSIGAGAFMDCGLGTVRLGAQLEEIGERAFSGNIGAVFETDSSNKSFMTDSGSIYTADGSRLIRAAFGLRSIDIPETVTCIAGGAFENCAHLTELDIPDSVSEIGSYAFNGCGSLKRVSLPQGLKRIEEYTFGSCGLLEDIRLPDGLTFIGREAFAGDGSLMTLTIPDTVSEIGVCAVGYVYYEEDAVEPDKGFVLRCGEGTVAHGYALENDIRCEIIPDGESSRTEDSSQRQDEGQKISVLPAAGLGCCIAAALVLVFIRLRAACVRRKVRR
ncbi:MAG: leucine-rich repeat domain-containing protein [Ruminococcus sp.]|nr:leucine-rich repeat domain-containing protein [Ruminococcus sp.]